MKRNYRAELLEVLQASTQLIKEGGEDEPENWSEALTAFFILLAEVCSSRMTPHEYIGGMEIAKHAVLKDHMDV